MGIRQYCLLKTPGHFVDLLHRCSLRHSNTYVNTLLLTPSPRGTKVGFVEKLIGKPANPRIDIGPAIKVNLCELRPAGILPVGLFNGKQRNSKCSDQHYIENMPCAMPIIEQSDKKPIQRPAQSFFQRLF